MSKNSYYTALWPLKSLTNHCPERELIKYNYRDRDWIKEYEIIYSDPNTETVQEVLWKYIYEEERDWINIYF